MFNCQNCERARPVELKNAGAESSGVTCRFCRSHYYHEHAREKQGSEQRRPRKNIQLPGHEELTVAATRLQQFGWRLCRNCMEVVPEKDFLHHQGRTAMCKLCRALGIIGPWRVYLFRVRGRFDHLTNIEKQRVWDVIGNACGLVDFEKLEETPEPEAVSDELRHAADAR